MEGEMLRLEAEVSNFRTGSRAHRRANASSDCARGQEASSRERCTEA